MISRRAFLQILSAAAAATTLEGVAAVVPPSPASVPVEPLVDWSTWNRIGCGLSPNGLAEWTLNGEVVNAYPSIVQTISRVVSPRGGTRAPGLAFFGEWFEVRIKFTSLPDAAKRAPKPIPCVAYDVDGTVRYAPGVQAPA